MFLEIANGYDVILAIFYGLEFLFFLLLGLWVILNTDRYLIIRTTKKQTKSGPFIHKDEIKVNAAFVGTFLLSVSALLLVLMLLKIFGTN